MISLIYGIQSDDIEETPTRQLLENELLLQAKSLMVYPGQSKHWENNIEIDYDENINESDLETKIKKYIIERVNNIKM